jgi:hypothetical protein
MSVEPTNAVTAATQNGVTHHLNCFGTDEHQVTMADYAADSRLLTPDGLLRWLRGDSPILREVVRGVRETGDVLRDAES